MPSYSRGMTSPAPSLPHILVVDDSGSVRRSLERTLSPYVRVTLAESAAEALSRLTPCVQLVLSDILMPDESGLDLTARLKKDYPDLPVVLFTGVVDAETRSRAHSLGVDTVLRKPLLTDQLLKVIQQWVGELPGQEVPARPPAQAVPGRAGAAVAVVPGLSDQVGLSGDAVVVSGPERVTVVDRVSEVCRKSGVLSATLFTGAGEVDRQWNLPLPPLLGSRVLELAADLGGWADLLGAEWLDGQFMCLPLSDRVLLLGQLTGQPLVLVVRGVAVAREVMQDLQVIAESSRHRGE